MFSVWPGAKPLSVIWWLTVRYIVWDGHSQFMFNNNNVQVDETIRVRKFSLYKVGTCRYSKVLMKMYEIVKETTCIFIIFIANIHKVSE